MSYCYGSARLTYVSVVACIAFELVYTTGVVVSRFLCELLVYCVSGSEGYFQVGSFEKVSDFIYGRAEVCEGSPLSIVIFFCLCEGGAVLFGC
jgi:hypothetical protein